MEAKEFPIVSRRHVSGRHAKTCRAFRNAKLGGAVVSFAAVGATAISLIAAVPAESSQKITSFTARDAAMHAATPKDQPHPLAGVPLPGKGITEGLKNDLKAKRQWLPSAADALKLAEAQVGVTEDASGGGTKFQKWFVASPWAVRGVERDGGAVGDYANANWCDMFVSWIGQQLGVKGMGADAFTRTHAEWFKDQGRWGDTPTPGAVVFFSWSGDKSIDSIDHVGMVIKDNHDGTIQTVEGNTDNAVKVRTRDASSVVGYGYPQYGPNAA
jgi:hypothetical protein